MTTVFFDLGDTLGTAMLSPPPVRLAELQLFPFVLPLLTDLKARGLRLGVISNTGDEPGTAVDRMLAPTGVLPLLDETLRIYSHDVGLTKADPAIFHLAADRAGHRGALDQCLFVGEDARERATAKRAGMKVSSHPLLVTEVLDGQRLRFVRLTSPRTASPAASRQALRSQPLVSMHIGGARGEEL